MLRYISSLCILQVSVNQIMVEIETPNKMNPKNWSLQRRQIKINQFLISETQLFEGNRKLWSAPC